MKTLGSPAFLCFTSACRSRAQPSSHRKLPSESENEGDGDDHDDDCYDDNDDDIKVTV